MGHSSITLYYLLITCHPVREDARRLLFGGEDDTTVGFVGWPHVGGGDIAEGLHELAAVHHEELVAFIEHFTDFVQQRIEEAQHP